MQQENESTLHSFLSFFAWPKYNVILEESWFSFGLIVVFAALNFTATYLHNGMILSLNISSQYFFFLILQKTHCINEDSISYLYTHNLSQL